MDKTVYILYEYITTIKVSQTQHFIVKKIILLTCSDFMYVHNIILLTVVCFV